MIHSSKFKNQATILKQILSENYKLDIKHSNALNIIAKLHGYKDWNVFSSILTSQAISNISDEKPNKTKNQADSSMLYDKHFMSGFISTVLGIFDEQNFFEVAEKTTDKSREIKVKLNDESCLPKNEYIVNDFPLKKIPYFFSKENVLKAHMGAAFGNMISQIYINYGSKNGASKIEELTENSLAPSSFFSLPEIFPGERQVEEKNNDVAKTIRMIIHEPTKNRPEDLTKLGMILELSDLPFVSIESTYKFIHAMLDRTYTIIPEYDSILIFLQDEQLATVLGENHN